MGIPEEEASGPASGTYEILVLLPVKVEIPDVIKPAVMLLIKVGGITFKAGFGTAGIDVEGLKEFILGLLVGLISEILRFSEPLLLLMIVSQEDA